MTSGYISQPNTAPLVSVIIPTFNRSEYITRAAKSVLDQSFKDLELLIVDDGSTDETGKIIESLGDPRIRYFFQPNQGVSRARNLGINNSRGNFISFLDSDDEWLPRKLEQQLESLESHPEYRIVHTNEIWIRKGLRVNQKKIHRKYGGWIFQYCLPLCVISPSSIMLSRDIFNKTGLFREDFPVCEDYELWLRLASAWPVLFIDDPLIVKYGGHHGQLSARHWGMDRFRVKALSGIIESGNLTQMQKRLAIQELKRKCVILEKGFRKRGKNTEADHFLAEARRKCDL